MNFQWARSTKLLAVLLAIAVAVVGVLTALVMRQQHDLSPVNGQIRLGTAPVAPGASVPAGADIVANPNVVTHPDPAAVPDAANVPAGPAPATPAPPADPAPRAVPAPPAAPAPGLATPHLTPAQLAPAPRVITPPRAAPPRQKPVKAVTPPARRVGPLPAPQQPAPAPVTPAPPQAAPDEPIKSDVPVKPGKPHGSKAPAYSQVPDKPAAKPTDPEGSTSTDDSDSSPEPTKPKKIHNTAPTPEMADTVVPCPPKSAVVSPVTIDPDESSASDLKAPDQEDVQQPDQ